MPAIIVDKSIYVDVKPSEAYEKLMNFNHWKDWSPWTIAEKNAKITVDENDKHYHWVGELVGEGEMRIHGSNVNESIDVDLSFIKPFKSKAKVSFIFKPEGDGTRIHWTLDNKMPFFMFFMKKLMTVMIGMDYKRGLTMLKEYLEEGKVKSNLNIIGNSKIEKVDYIGINTTCSMDAIGENMTKDFTELMNFAKENNLEVDGYGFSIYHEWKLAKNETSYTAAIPMKKTPNNLPENILSGSIPATKTFAVKHTGPYHHIGNAWTAIFMRDRAKVFKKNKKFHPVELYLNSPETTPQEELITEIHMGVK